MTIGERIRSCRTNANMTQKELSEKIGLTPKMISFYENNERMPPIDVLTKLANIFETTSDYIIGLKTVERTSFPTVIANEYFGKRLNDCIYKTGDSIEEFSLKTDISKTDLLRFIKGTDKPAGDLLFRMATQLGVSIDYLLGYSNQPRKYLKNEEPPFQFDHEISLRLKEQANQMGESYALLAELLRIEEEEVFNFFEYGFVPHISVFVEIVEHFLVSSDFLLNRSNSTMTVQAGEERLLKSFRMLNNDSKTIALSELLKLEREEVLVAAKDKYLSNPGKLYPSNGTEG